MVLVKGVESNPRALAALIAPRLEALPDVAVLASYHRNHEHLPALAARGTRAQRLHGIADYIAGMTDRFAIARHEIDQAGVPSGSILKTLPIRRRRPDYGPAPIVSSSLQAWEQEPRAEQRAR